MAGLLVSVRSAVEARLALDGGAAVVDVKEPRRGPLGRADATVWQDVVAAVAGTVPVSVALGELRDGDAGEIPSPPEGVAYRKLGLAGCLGSDWRAAWRRIRSSAGGRAAWIAVVYADWEHAGAPPPDDVLAAAVEASCAGLLVDTHNKGRPCPLGPSWSAFLERARRAGLRIALAGRLDLDEIARLAPLRPDLFAVRGAACAGGDRRGLIDPARVRALVRAAGGMKKTLQSSCHRG